MRLYQNGPIKLREISIATTRTRKGCLIIPSGTIIFLHVRWRQSCEEFVRIFPKCARKEGKNVQDVYLVQELSYLAIVQYTWVGTFYNSKSIKYKSHSIKFLCYELPSKKVYCNERYKCKDMYLEQQNLAFYEMAQLLLVKTWLHEFLVGLDIAFVPEKRLHNIAYLRTCLLCHLYPLTMLTGSTCNFKRTNSYKNIYKIALFLRYDLLDL